MSNEIKNEFDTSEFQPRMTPNIPGKLKYGRTFLIGLAFMTSSIFWTYYNFMLPILLEEHFIELGITTGTSTLVGFVMVLDNIIAILMLPVFGSLSDRTRSKYGKRTPYILIGCISGIIAFSVIGLISPFRGTGALIGLISVVMWFNLSMAFYRSASVSLMPDLTDPDVRSTGNAIINLMGAVSMVIGLSAKPFMEIIFNAETEHGLDASRAGGFYYVSLITALALILLILTIKETPTGRKFFQISEKSIAIDPITLEYKGEHEQEEKEKVTDTLKEVFTAPEKSLLFMLLTIFMFFMGYNAIDTFYSTYATKYLNWAEGDASTALIIAPVTMVLTAVFAGKLGDNFGRRLTIMIGLIGLASSIFILIFMKNTTYMMIMFGVVGIFYGLININTIVIIWQMSPKGKIGAYTGAYYFFSQFAATLSPVVAGLTFDIYKLIINQRPSFIEGNQYIMLFPFVIFFEIIAIILLTRVKRGESERLTKKQIEEYQDKYAQDD